MKKLFLFLAFSAFFTAVFGQSYFVRADGMALFPLGTLNQRFLMTTGGTVGFGQDISESMSWAGRFEYFKFADKNSDELYYKRKRTINKRDYEFRQPIKQIELSLETAGLSAEMQYNAFSFGDLETKLVLGFGVYYWSSVRGPYKDSVKVIVPNGNITATQDTTILLETFNVPGSTQFDWSGGFSAGIELAYKVYDPVWVNFGAQYKAVIGEIWPTLKLDMENVAAMQMGTLRAGITVKF